MNEETITISKTVYEGLLKDKYRLDYLDAANQVMNGASGTLYGWQVTRSPNVNRLSVNFPYGIDLHDSQAVGCYPTGWLSIRSAIDFGFHTGLNAEVLLKQDRLFVEKLMQWAKDWKLDGDVVQCRGCRRALHFTKRNESLIHRAGCRVQMGYPWELLRALA